MRRLHRNPLRPRRGTALLFVLATLVLVMSLVAGTARVIAALRLSETLAAQDQLAHAVSRGVEARHGPIQVWLSDQSRQVVLLPGSDLPAVLILEDRLQVDGNDISICITAYDQFGMAPPSILIQGSPLRLALPPAIRRTIDAAHLDATSPLGLDSFGAREPESDTRLFPPAMSSGLSTREPGNHAPEKNDAVGAWVATHNLDPPHLNINTASLLLIEHALRSMGRGGENSIREARGLGNSAVIPDESSRSSAGGSQIRLTTSSDCWGFRIDIEVGAVSHRRWCIYQYQHRQKSNTQDWLVVQRLRIDE